MEIALDMEYPIHKPVMVREAMKFLMPHSNGIYVDATLGLGGHTEAILEYANSHAKVIALDIDDEAISVSKNYLSRFETQIKFINKNFSQIDKVLESLSINEVDGIVADLGISKFRSKKPIETTLELANIVLNAIPKKFYPHGRHPATKTFQALRIAVNNELENLEIFLKKAPLFLKPGGRIVIISFHSLEDRLVKNTFKGLSSACICPPELPRCGCGRKSILKNLTHSPLTPSLEEINENPRARSAKLRAGERISYEREWK